MGKLEASKAIEQPQVPNDAAALDSKMAGARGGFGGRMPAGQSSTQHVVISDPNRYLPTPFSRVEPLGPRCSRCSPRPSLRPSPYPRTMLPCSSRHSSTRPSGCDRTLFLYNSLYVLYV